jgi:hypothetical protein
MEASRRLRPRSHSPVVRVTGNHVGPSRGSSNLPLGAFYSPVGAMQSVTHRGEESKALGTTSSEFTGVPSDHVPIGESRSTSTKWA